MSDATEEVVVQPNATPPTQADPPVVVDPNETPEQKATRERDEAGRFRKPVQPRIDELTRKAHEKDREAAYWRQRAEAAEKPPEPPKPKPEAKDYDDYGAYVEALTDWKADEKIDVKLKERDEKAAVQQQTQKRATNWSERVANIQKEIPEYDAEMQAADVPVAKHVTELLLDSEEGPRIALHLCRNPDVADKLNAMTEREAAQEIGRLEVRLAPSATPPPVDDPADPAAVQQDPPEPPKPKTSTAPPPPKPVGSNRSTEVPLAKMSMDEYVAKRKSQGAKWARR